MMTVAVVGVSSAMSSSACGGKTLQVGYDDDALGLHPEQSVDLDALAKRCAAPSGETAPPSGLSPQRTLELATPLLVGRWFACPGSPPPISTSFPNAFELAPDHAAFTLQDASADHIFVRGSTTERYEVAWSLRKESLVVRFRSEDLVVACERNPMRMSVELNGTTWRFAKG